MYGLTRKSFNEMFDTFDEAIKRFYRLPNKNGVSLQIYVNEVVWRTYPITNENGRYHVQGHALSDIFPIMSLLEQEPQKQTISIRECATNVPTTNPEEDPEEIAFRRSQKYGPLMELKRLFYQEFKGTYPLSLPPSVRLQFDVIEIMKQRGEIQESHDNIEAEQALFDEYSKELAVEDEFEEEWDEIFN